MIPRRGPCGGGAWGWTSRLSRGGGGGCCGIDGPAEELRSAAVAADGTGMFFGTS
jgi:hypothetical protein